MYNQEAKSQVNYMYFMFVSHFKHKTPEKVSLFFFPSRFVDMWVMMGLIPGVCTVPVVSGVFQGSVAGDAFALPLVEGVQRVRVVAGLPAPRVQVTPLIKTLHHVLPFCIRDL